MVAAGSISAWAESSFLFVLVPIRSEVYLRVGGVIPAPLWHKEITYHSIGYRCIIVKKSLPAILAAVDDSRSDVMIS